MVMLCLELFIGFLQAYIFTMLTAQYIGSSVGEAH
jgi:F-type H+-transporting ATPase subunit a